MFGESIIVGHSTGKIDSKNRIFLPSFTGATHKDKILVEKTTYEDDFALKLYSYHKFYELIEQLKKMQATASSFEEFMQFQEKIEKMCIYLSAKIQVDSQGRIVIPNGLFIQSNWSNEQLVSFHGLGDTLIITQPKK